MKIVIITDGNSKQGLGHIYQSKTLAEYLLEKKGYDPEITFLTKSEAYVADLIRNDGFPVEQLSGDEDIFNFLRVSLPQVVIFDKIDVSPLLAKRIKSELNLKLAIFTNLTEANQYADISVLADTGSNLKNISKKEGNRIKFLGPKYWLMRPEFNNYHLCNRVRSATVSEITLIFGGADPQDYTSLVLTQLMRSSEKFSINVILGNAYRNEENLCKIQNTYKDSPSVVRILRNASNVAELMFHSDLVFVSPGLSLFEALRVGSPVIAFYQSDLQKEAYDGYVAAYGKDSIDCIIDMIHDRNFVFPEDEFISQMEIGCGKDEIISQIFN